MTHTTTQDIFKFRSDLINQLIVLFTIASIIEVAILFSHLPTLGITLYFIVRMTLIVGLWLLMLFRYKISYFGRVSLLAGGTLISIVVHLVQFGPALNAKSFLITLTFFAMMFISERAGWLIVSSIVVIFSVLGFLMIQGYLVYQFDYQSYILEFQTWIGIIFALTTYSAITGYVAMRFLRFLLHTLLGYLQLLQDTSLNWQQRGHLASIRQSSEHLHTLVNTILDTARLERQQPVLNPQPCCLLELLKHVTNMIQLKTQSKKLHFEFIQLQPLPVGQTPRECRTDSLNVENLSTEHKENT